MKKKIGLFVVAFLLGVLVAVRVQQLHIMATIKANDYTQVVKHPDGFYPSDYETIDDGEATVIYYEYPENYYVNGVLTIPNNK